MVPHLCIVMSWCHRHHSCENKLLTLQERRYRIISFTKQASLRNSLSWLLGVWSLLLTRVVYWHQDLSTSVLVLTPNLSGPATSAHETMCHLTFATLSVGSTALLYWSPTEVPLIGWLSPHCWVLSKLTVVLADAHLPRWPICRPNLGLSLSVGPHLVSYKREPWEGADTAMMGLILWQRTREHSQRRESKLCPFCGLWIGLDSVFDWDKKEMHSLWNGFVCLQWWHSQRCLLIRHSVQWGPPPVGLWLSPVLLQEPQL